MNNTKVTIPGKLQSLNEYLNALNRNKFVGAKMKKDASHLVGWYLKNLEPQGEPPYIYKADYYEATKRRDKDNVSAFARKVILDSLQEVGVLKEDDWTGILGFQEMIYLDPKNPRIEIQLIGK